MAAPPPPPRGGLSLYDNLLDPSDSSSSATISSAPVRYNQAGGDPSATSEPPTKKAFQPALQFQQIRRPQVKQPTKPKAPLSRPLPPAAQNNAGAPQPPPPPPPQSSAAAPPPPGPPQKSTLADWTASTQEDEWRYGFGEKRQRGGRKNKKKKQHHMQVETDWDEIYDPARPTNISEYLRSDERVDEVREWKALLYRHRRKPQESDMSDSEDEDSRPVPSNQFAPPSSYTSVPPPPRSPPAPVPIDTTGDDAYARRLAMSQDQAVPQPPPPPDSDKPLPPPLSAPPQPTDTTTISKAPVRYTQPSTAAGVEDEDEAYSPPPKLGLGSADSEEPPARSSRPGQAGFAQRFMSKYGWTKGSGLGADETGITNALSVKIDKRRKKADADGGGWAEPGGKGRIMGGKRKEEASKFGTMSDVIVLQNMLENMPDLQAEISDGLGQEIGEECGEKYGRVERLYIDQSSRQVFIKFTDQVSALRAVNELEGRVFNGNTIVPKFFDTEKFEKGMYR